MRGITDLDEIALLTCEELYEQYLEEREAQGRGLSRYATSALGFLVACRRICPP